MLGDRRQPGHLHVTMLHVSLGLGDTRVPMGSATLKVRGRHQRDAPSQHSTDLGTDVARPIGNAERHL